MTTHWSPIYTGDPDHDDALEEASDATEARIKAITMQRVKDATRQQRLDAVATYLGGADPDDLARSVYAVLYGDMPNLTSAWERLAELVTHQLYSDIEPDVIREVYAEISARRAHGQEEGA